MEVAKCSLKQLQSDIIGGAVSRNSDFVLFAIQMAEGLEYLHGQKIVHRDIKPANILAVWPDDVQNIKDSFHCVTLKLCDFGLSRSICDGTATATIVGTQKFYAPEMSLALQTGTSFHGDYKSADVFSLGLVFYHLLFNRLPENLIEFVNSKQCLIDASDKLIIENKLDGILKSMLTWEVEERISSMGVVNLIKPLYHQIQLESIQDSTKLSTAKMNAKPVRKYGHL
jgi:serine/threonine protein kinase